MRLEKIVKNLFLMISSVFIVNNLYAETTHIFCATKEKKWEWLKINDQYVTISGEWKQGIVSNKICTSCHFVYFEPNFDFVEALQKKCIEIFGIEYVYAQPANNRLNDWGVFGKENKNLYPRIIYYRLFLPNSLHGEAQLDTK
jgi:hypothetical protein